MHVSDYLTTYKLLILYMIDVINYPLTNAQISDFILGNGYTDYFNLQHAISDLQDTNMISSLKVQNSTRYTLTDEGKETLNLLVSHIPSAMREDARIYLKKNNYSIKETNSFTGIYEPLDNDEYLVKLKVDEDRIPILEVSLSVPTKEAAQDMCNNWREKSQEIYTYILKTLLPSDN